MSVCYDGECKADYLLDRMEEAAEHREQLEGQIEALEAEAAQLREALQMHHDWHLNAGVMWAPTNENEDSDFVSWDAADAYSESAMCESTVAALSATPAARKQP